MTRLYFLFFFFCITSTPALPIKSRKKQRDSQAKNVPRDFSKKSLGVSQQKSTPLLSSSVEENKDIQLELFMGYWMATMPNTKSTSPVTMHMLPTAVARGEWSPYVEEWGLYLNLEQTITSFSKGSEKAFYSDWSAGLFIEEYLTVGWQTRISIGHRQHLADDLSNAPIIAYENKDFRVFTVQLLSNYYFPGRWMIGVDIEYGIPGRLSGRGRTQSLLGLNSRIGYKLSKHLYFLSEIGHRTYQTSFIKPESMLISQCGMRLDF